MAPPAMLLVVNGAPHIACLDSRDLTGASIDQLVWDNLNTPHSLSFSFSPFPSVVLSSAFLPLHATVREINTTTLAASPSSSSVAIDSFPTLSDNAAIDDQKNKTMLRSRLFIIGSGTVAHTTTIYATRDKLFSVLFKGWMANDVSPGGQLTTTTNAENFQGFMDSIIGTDLINHCGSD